MFKKYKARPVKVDAAKISRVVNFEPVKGLAVVRVVDGVDLFYASSVECPAKGDYVIEEKKGFFDGYVCPRKVFERKYEGC